MKIIKNKKHKTTTDLRKPPKNSDKKSIGMMKINLFQNSNQLQINTLFWGFGEKIPSNLQDEALKKILELYEFLKIRLETHPLDQMNTKVFFKEKKEE